MNKPIVIAFDGTKLQPREQAGVEKYTLNLLISLSKIDNSNNYRVFLRDQKVKDWIITLISNPRFEFIVLPTFPSLIHFSIPFNILLNPVDVYFSPNHTVPLLKIGSYKVVSMIHGFEYRIDRKNSFRKLALEFFMRNTLFQSNKLISPSEHIKKQLLTQNIKENKIEVIQEGVEKSFERSSSEKIKSVKEKYTLGSNGYILFVSTVQPRKNLLNLIKAFEKVSKETDLNLVISGKMGWDFDSIIQLPKIIGIENRVKFLGWTENSDLPSLLSGATSYVNPSFEEGFGLPVLEAMSCQTVCVLSDIPPLRELAKDNAFYFDPNNSDSISTAILNSVKDSGLRNKFTENGKKISESYSWDETASKTLKLFENMYENI